MSSSAPIDTDSVLRELESLLSGSSGVNDPGSLFALTLYACAIHLKFSLRTPTTSTTCDSPQALPLPLHLPEWKPDLPLWRLYLTHTPSNQQVDMAVVKLGENLIVGSANITQNQAKSLDLCILDIFTPSAFPLNPSESGKDLSSFHGFQSSEVFEQCVKQIITEVFVPLIPATTKKLETVFKEDIVNPSEHTSNPAPRPSHLPAGFLPDLGGPLGMIPQPGFSPKQPSHFPSVGRSDLEPLGGLPPIGLPGQSQSIGGAGMFVGPTHPLFDHQGDSSHQTGPWGGDGFLPPSAVPPGARFDPVGPFTMDRRRSGGNAFGSSKPNWGDEAPPRQFSDYNDMFS